MVESIIKPKQPKGKGWAVCHEWFKYAGVLKFEYPVTPYIHESGIFVLSALEVCAPENKRENLGPEWHLSMSFKGGRCDRNQAKWVLKEFDLEDATEDNHIKSGFVRNWWRAVADKYSGYECPCKESEPAIVEDKGDFIWRGVPNS